MKRLFLMLMGFALALSGYGRTFVAGDTMTDRDKWVKQTFGKGQLPFSFELDGKYSTHSRSLLPARICKYVVR